MGNTIEDQGIQNRELTLSAAAVAVFISILFGANPVAIKLTFRGIGVFTTPAIRFTLASLTILSWALFTGKPLRIKSEQVKEYSILALFFIGQFFVYYFGMNRTNASRSMLIANLQPFFVLFLSHFLIAGDTITRRKLTGILLGFIGVAFVFLEKTALESEFRVGDLGVLGSTFIWACNIVYVKRIIHKFEAFQVVLYPMLFALPVFWLGSLLLDTQRIYALTTDVMVGLVFQSFVTASFALIVWSNMLQRYGAVALHSFVFILPVVGVSLGGLILHEPITPKILVALVLIVIGTFVVNWNGVTGSARRFQKHR